jgi:hypothetical protein
MSAHLRRMKYRTNEEERIIVLPANGNTFHNAIKDAMCIKLLRKDKDGPFGSINLVLVFATLSGLVQLFLQMAFPITVHLRFVLIYAILVGNRMFIHHIPAHNAQLHEALEAESEAHYYDKEKLH